MARVGEAALRHLLAAPVCPHGSPTTPRHASSVIPRSFSLLQIFCNPNAHTTAFDAKLLVTLWSQGAVSGSGLKVTTEARLSTFTSDLDSLLQG